MSPRQSEVGALVCTGMTNKQIAIRLGISPATVKIHLALLMSKLGVHRRTQVALKLTEKA